MAGQAFRQPALVSGNWATDGMAPLIAYHEGLDGIRCFEIALHGYEGYDEQILDLETGHVLEQRTIMTNQSTWDVVKHIHEDSLVFRLYT